MFHLKSRFSLCEDSQSSFGMLMSWHLESRVSAAHQLGWEPLQFTLWWRGDAKTGTTSSSSGTPLPLTSQRGAAHASRPSAGLDKKRKNARSCTSCRPEKPLHQPRAHGGEAKANLPGPLCSSSNAQRGRHEREKKNGKKTQQNVRCLLQGTAGRASVCRRLNWTLAEVAA